MNAIPNPPAFARPAVPDVQFCEAQPGVSTRDWFAATVRIDRHKINNALGLVLLGEDAPTTTGELSAREFRLADMQYWARVEAAYRFEVAQAMLAEKHRRDTADRAAAEGGAS